jgi:endo-1,3-1,4-beta-glycanase ExoK
MRRTALIVAAVLACLLVGYGVAMLQLGGWRVHAPPAGVPNAVPTPPLATAGAGFTDRFRTLDEPGRWAISDGWSNGAWTANDWRRSQVSLQPEGLAITMAASAGGEKAYSSGEIATSRSYRYGYFEARFRMPRGSGLVGAMFTFARDAGPRSWNEIDMEIAGQDTRTIELTYHVAGRPKKHVEHLPFDAAEGFHTYAFDWRPDVIRWYIDNQLVLESRGRDVEAMNTPQRFIVSLWNSEQLHRWVGPIHPEESPWTFTLACAAHAESYPGHALCDAASAQ